MQVFTPIAERSLEVLEFPKVRQRLASFASFSASRELCLSLSPIRDYSQLLRSQELAKQASQLLELRSNLSVAGMQDIRILAEKAARGGALTVEELLLVLRSSRSTAALKAGIYAYAARFPELWKLAERIRGLDAMVETLEESLGPRGEVRDNASPLLGALRREVREAHDLLQSRLQSIITGRTRNMVQEPIITQRGGRYVIPVKADFRGEFKGVVHDVSASGATLFMEPLEVVEVANRWREAQLHEEREVERTLRRLSEMVGAEESAIRLNIEVAAEIDLALAKARYCAQIGGVFPRLLAPDAADGVGGGDAYHLHLDLVNARHPLLSGRVVPFSLEVGSDFFLLLITGPNTGGKTVTLKSVGLLSIMALAALPIPADEGSAIPFFDGVYADIGDEQSIEQSLSTFSSHMGNIIKILNAATSSSLVLLDELGAGTDPQDGSALAKAILSHLLENRTTSVITTHHSDLKAYTHNAEGASNASMEFDPETLAPTFRLSVGLPGRSNAIAIARRLGLPERILSEARSYQPASQTQVDELLVEIQRERDRTAQTRAEAEARWKMAEEELRRAREELREIEESKSAVLEVARLEAEEALREVRQQLREATQEIEKGLREMARERLMEAAARLEAAEGQMERAVFKRPQPPRAAQVIKGTITTGSQVWVAKLQQYGEVLSPPTTEGEVEVQIGTLKLRAAANELELAGARSARPPLRGSYPVAPLAPITGAETEVHLRGMRVEEALTKMDEFLHEAYLKGASHVRVVHGKGTGAMRRAVRDTLARHPLVASFETASQNAGGEGVTVVELAG